MLNGVCMETRKISETLIEGLVSSKQNDDGDQFGGKFPEVSQCLDLGKVKCEESAFAPVKESRCVDSCSVKGSDRVGSSGRGDVSIKGISLFVELTGGMSKKPNGESFREDKSRLMYGNQVKVDVGQQESEVNVGDFVWAIIKKQSWWPGIVCDAANAPKEAANGPTREDDILVKCFGNDNFIWCSPYEVRPFVGYFDRLPNQSKAKKFLVALEKAVTEFGHRVKAEFTCRCFSKMKTEKTGNVGDFSVTRFEPARFLDYIKDLGRDVSMTHEIDNVVKQSCLSAFYRSLGHLQIPMHQLMPANGTPLKIKTEEENGYFGDDTENTNETREKRKSRFLSYPGECGIDESNVDDYEGVDLNKTSGQGQSQPVKKPRKKWTRKNKEVRANVCSSEVLSQLQFAAQDCLFPCESKNFDSVNRFINGFRKSAFKDSSSEIPVDVSNSNHQISQETLPKKVKKKKDKSVISPTIGNNSNHASQFMHFQNVGSFNTESMANQRTEWPANQVPIFGFGYPPPTQPTQPPLRKLAPKRPNKVAENVTPMYNWNADISTLPNVNNMEGLYQAPVFFTNRFGPIPPYYTGNYGQPQVGPVPNGLTSVPKKRGRKRKKVDLQAHPGSTMGLQAHPGSNMGFQAHPGSTMGLQAHPGSTMGLQAHPGSNMGLQAHPGSTMGLQAHPGTTMGLQAHPGTTMGLQAHPGTTMGLQTHPGTTMGFQAHPGTTMGLQAHPATTMGLQAHPGSTMGLQALPGSTMGLQAHPSTTMGLQANPSSTMGLQANPGSNMGLQANPGSNMGLQANPGSTMHLQANPANPGSTMHLQANPANPGSVMHLPAHPGSLMGLQAHPGSTMDLQANPGSTVIPNLNGSITGQKKQKRANKNNEVGVPCIDLSYNKVQQDNLELKGTAFLLKFSSDYPLPSIQDLNSIFSKFGALIESETQVLNETLSGQVVFLDSSSAGGAFWGLQNDKPFGPVLVNYKIQHLAGSESTVPFKTPIKSPSGPKPVDLNTNSIVSPTMIPDLNTNSTEVQIIKRSKTIEEIRLPSNHNHLSNNKVHQGNEVTGTTGTALLLTFSPNFPLPSIQDLNSVFCKYGELKERETRVFGQSFTGQVVFVKPSTAADAIHRLHKDQPFGVALISYQLHHLHNVQPAVRVKSPVNALKPPQDLGVIKKNLERMNSMLEKSGDSLSPEMRRKLESEIKGLMNKVSAVDGSSSSSSCL
ncbi:putative non-specific serine/threonine protein kinase [Helianthus annuus]|nr:putative non-specific serine/threonine protein kinase [Helianthus annuus]KAJ0748185.1 putative non-specific serine/threonine protein kinase [Helianthus annuus]